MNPKPLLCPRCRQLIGSDESSCSWCGARRPRWGAASKLQSMFREESVITMITAVTGAIYILSLALSSSRGLTLNPMRALSPDQTSLFLLGATGTVPIDRFGRWWTLVSASYLHGGILHIVFNLMALRQIGPLVLREYGTSRMFVIYTLGGASGFALSYIAGVPFTIGASAAVCGLIGSALYFGRSRGGGYGQAVYSEVSGWVVGLILFGFVMPGINNWGHGGGILGGILLGFLLGYEEKRRESPLHRMLALACLAATVAILGWATVSAVVLRLGV